MIIIRTWYRAVSYRTDSFCVLLFSATRQTGVDEVGS